MTYSHFVSEQMHEAKQLCEEALMSVETCVTAWSQFCQPSEELVHEIHREIARAIG